MHKDKAKLNLSKGQSKTYPEAQIVFKLFHIGTEGLNDDDFTVGSSGVYF